LAFIAVTLTVAGFSGLLDLFAISAAASCRLRFGAEGLRVFSEAMIVNVVLCTAFAVLAARWLRSASVVFPLGIILVTGAIGLIACGGPSKTLVFLAVLVMTIGEIAFTALAQFAVMRSTPGGTKNQASIYGASLAVQSLGRIAGAAVAFPIVVHGEHPLRFLGACAAVALALSVASAVLLRPGLRSRGAAPL
jgi:hypothetical protein